MEEENKNDGKLAWLKEHDEVQSELSRMKQDLLKDIMSSPVEEDEQEKRSEDMTPGGQEGSLSDETRTAPTAPVGDVVPEEKGRPVKEGPGPGSNIEGEGRTEDEGGGEEGEEEDEGGGEEDGEGEEPGFRRDLSDGIPKHPELSSFIARVMEHENRLNKRKFEKERDERRRSLGVGGGQSISVGTTAPDGKQGGPEQGTGEKERDGTTDVGGAGHGQPEQTEVRVTQPQEQVEAVSAPGPGGDAVAVGPGSLSQRGADPSVRETPHTHPSADSHRETTEGPAGSERSPPPDDRAESDSGGLPGSGVHPAPSDNTEEVKGRFFKLKRVFRRVRKE